MKLVGRIPIEPLDEERLTNLERRLVIGVSELSARPMRASRSRHFAVAGAAMAVLVAGVIGWKLHGAPPAATLAGSLTVAVRTDTDHSMLDIGDATIDSDPATAFAVTRPSGGVLVVMEHGKVELDVQKRHNRPPLVVRAGDTEVEVVGTHFSVAWDGHGEVDVRVTEGTVRVKHQQLVTIVEKGHAWRTGRGLAAMADVPADTRAGARNAGANAIDGAAGSRPSELDPHGGSDLDIDPEDDPDILHGHHAIAPDGAGSVGAQGSAAQGSAATSGIDTMAKPTTHRIKLSKKDPYYAIKSAVEAQRVEPPMPIAEVTSTVDLMKEYSKIVTDPNKTGDLASKAFYSMALAEHLSSDDQEHDDRALRILDGYFHRFSGGKFSGSDDYKGALWLRVRILCSRAIDDKCRQAAYLFSKSGANGPKAGIADQIIGLP